MTNSLKLKSLLLLQGVKLKDLANLLGVSIQTISMKINNKRPFKLSEILKVCEFLHIEDIQERFLIFFSNNVDLHLQNA